MLTVSGNVCNSSGCKNFNETRRDSISILPYEDLLGIFSHVNLATLGTICSVRKEWKQLEDEPYLWKIAIYRDIAFGNDKWAKCFGADVVKDEKEDFSSLPWKEFIEDCKKFKSIFPEYANNSILMLVRLPKTLNGGLTLISLGDLAKKYFPDSDTGYGYICSDIVNELGGKSIDGSCWVSMLKFVLPGSRKKSYGEQLKIIAELAEKSLIGYEDPEALPAVTCILSQYFDSQTRFFSDNNPRTYTRCKDKVQGFQSLAVGDFARAGLSISDRSDTGHVGVAPLRKF